MRPLLPSKSWVLRVVEPTKGRALAGIQATRDRAGEYVNVFMFFVANIISITIIVQKYKKISIRSRFFPVYFEKTLKKERIQRKTDKILAFFFEISDIMLIFASRQSDRDI